jgi:hypothetical protein
VREHGVMLSALVHHRGNMIDVGKGFFNLSVDIGRLNPKADDVTRTVFLGRPPALQPSRKWTRSQTSHKSILPSFPDGPSSTHAGPRHGEPPRSDLGQTGHRIWDWVGRA